MPRPRFYGNAKITGWSVGAVIDRPPQPTRQCSLTGKRHRRAMLAPTTESVNCVNQTIPRRGGVTPPYGVIKINAR